MVLILCVVVFKMLSQWVRVGHIYILSQPFTKSQIRCSFNLAFTITIPFCNPPQPFLFPFTTFFQPSSNEQETTYSLGVGTGGWRKISKIPKKFRLPSLLSKKIHLPSKFSGIFSPPLKISEKNFNSPVTKITKKVAFSGRKIFASPQFFREIFHVP